MSVELDLDISFFFDSSFHEDTIAERELTLIRSILPEVLQEIALQAELNKE